MANADFGAPVLPETKKAKLTMNKKGDRRSFLKGYETLPSQPLTAYGASAYVKQTDAEAYVKQTNAEVWKHFSREQVTLDDRPIP